MPDDVLDPSKENTVANHRKAIRYTSASSIATITFKPIFRPRKHLDIELSNISSKGARITSKYKFSIKTKIIFQIIIQENCTWKIPAKIVRQYSNTEYGISFDSIQHDLIDEIIKNDADFAIT